MAETKPEYVRFEMDVYWIVHPGQDPVKLLEKYGKRFELMHIKDMKRGTPGGFTGQSDVTNNVALGEGIIDWPSVFRAAKKAGVSGTSSKTSRQPLLCKSRRVFVTSRR